MPLCNCILTILGRRAPDVNACPIVTTATPPRSLFPIRRPRLSPVTPFTRRGDPCDRPGHSPAMRHSWSSHTMNASRQRPGSPRALTRNRFIPTCVIRSSATGQRIEQRIEQHRARPSCGRRRAVYTHPTAGTSPHDDMTAQHLDVHHHLAQKGSGSTISWSHDRNGHAHLSAREHPRHNNRTLLVPVCNVPDPVITRKESTPQRSSLPPAPSTTTVPSISPHPASAAVVSSSPPRSAASRCSSSARWPSSAT